MYKPPARVLCRTLILDEIDKEKKEKNTEEIIGKKTENVCNFFITFLILHFLPCINGKI